MDESDTLDRVDRLPIYQYNYKCNPESRKCRGPVAQDWYDLFPSDKSKIDIDSMDLDGVTLAAVKGLSKLIKQQRDIINDQSKRISFLEEKLLL